MFFTHKSTPFWLLTISIFLLLFFPYLFSNGMFMDGLLYAAVSRNLAEMPDMFGNLFNLSYTETILKECYDQPPLAMWLQAFMFRVFGDSIYVERVYSFLTALSCLLLIYLIWNIAFRDDETGREVAWLPFFFWSITPLVFWSFTNNMLENTLSVFALLAVYFSLKGMTTEKHLYVYVGSSSSIFFAFLSKSFVGLFPLVTIPIYWLVKREPPFAVTLKIFLKFITCTAIIFAVFFSFEAPRDFFRENFKAQIIPSMQGEFNTVAGNRFHLLKRLIKELMPALIFSIIFWGCKSRMKVESAGQSKREWFWIFLLLAVSGSFPIMLSFKQKGYYLVPSLPFYAMALAVLIKPAVYQVAKSLCERDSVYRHIKWFAIAFMIFSVLFSLSQIGKIRRDADRLTDSQLTAQAIHPLKSISIHESLTKDWNLIGYLARNHKISVDWNNLNEFYLINKASGSIPDNYQIVNIPTVKYQLLRRTID